MRLFSGPLLAPVSTGPLLCRPLSSRLALHGLRALELYRDHRATISSYGPCSAIPPGCPSTQSPPPTTKRCSLPCRALDSGTKNQPKEEVFRAGYPADIRGSFARISRPKTSVRALQVLEKQAFWARTSHDPKARTSTTPGDLRNFGSDKLWAEFSFPIDWIRTNYQYSTESEKCHQKTFSTSADDNFWEFSGTVRPEILLHYRNYFSGI